MTSVKLHKYTIGLSRAFLEIELDIEETLE
jgi:hypothetical protein